jgi:acyl dehydratase
MRPSAERSPVLNVEQIRRFRIPSIDHAYGWKDTILYALGLGYGPDPLDAADLRFVYERDLMVVPSLCNTLAHPGFWLNKPELGIHWVKVLHAEQSFTMHRPLPPIGVVQGRYAIKSIEDKAADKGALLTVEKTPIDRESSDVYCIVTTAIFLRGDGGGFGAPSGGSATLSEREPDLTLDLPTLPQTALICRLNGDTNPLHADPAVALKAGFARPILHGLAIMGIATRALLRAVCNQDPSRLINMHVRFSSPVYPGETIRTEIYQSGAEVAFRCRVPERGVVVLDPGRATVAANGD